MKIRHRLTLLFCLTCFGLSPSADALNILLTNDDGFEASTLHALYQTLKAKGHSVVIVSETQDNSGKGGAADFFKPIGPLSGDSRAGFVKAGSAGLGNLPSDPDVFYIDGTPLAAALYGIDSVALKKWGSVPDLVISGPNYGNNTGLSINSSGTVNAALICINRGVPAIAVSTAVPAAYKSFDKLTPGDVEYEVAKIVDRIVAVVEAGRHGVKGRLLPVRTGLNVNIPVFLPGSADRLKFKLSRVGSAAAATPVFVDDLSKDEAVRRFGLASQSLPGISLALTDSAQPRPDLLVDRDPRSEQNVVNAGYIAISVFGGNRTEGIPVRKVQKELEMLISR